ncbi:hypothetical protein [Paraburkholderia jirisanensis]
MRTPAALTLGWKKRRINATPTKPIVRASGRLYSETFTLFLREATRGIEKFICPEDTSEGAFLDESSAYCATQYGIVFAELASVVLSVKRLY